MALKSNHSGIINRLNVKEICLIIGITCCVGIVFNFIWVNRVPFITPSKAELYAKKEIPTLTLEETKEKLDQGGIIFLDAREAGDYELKHIKGALSFPVSSRWRFSVKRS